MANVINDAKSQLMSEVDTTALPGQDADVLEGQVLAGVLPPVAPGKTAEEIAQDAHDKLAAMSKADGGYSTVDLGDGGSKADRWVKIQEEAGTLGFGRKIVISELNGANVPEAERNAVLAKVDGTTTPSETPPPPAPPEETGPPEPPSGPPPPPSGGRPGGTRRPPPSPPSSAGTPPSSSSSPGAAGGMPPELADLGITPEQWDSLNPEGQAYLQELASSATSSGSPSPAGTSGGSSPSTSSSASSGPSSGSRAADSVDRMPSPADFAPVQLTDASGAPLVDAQGHPVQVIQANATGTGYQFAAGTTPEQQAQAVKSAVYNEAQQLGLRSHGARAAYVRDLEARSGGDPMKIIDEFSQDAQARSYRQAGDPDPLAKYSSPLAFARTQALGDDPTDAEVKDFNKKWKEGTKDLSPDEQWKKAYEAGTDEGTNYLANLHLVDAQEHGQEKVNVTDLQARYGTAYTDTDAQTIADAWDSYAKDTYDDNIASLRQQAAQAQAGGLMDEAGIYNRQIEDLTSQRVAAYNQLQSLYGYPKKLSQFLGQYADGSPRFQPTEAMVVGARKDRETHGEGLSNQIKWGYEEGKGWYDKGKEVFDIGKGGVDFVRAEGDRKLTALKEASDTSKLTKAPDRRTDGKALVEGDKTYSEKYGKAAEGSAGAELAKGVGAGVSPTEGSMFAKRSDNVGPDGKVKDRRTRNAENIGDYLSALNRTKNFNP